MATRVALIEKNLPHDAAATARVTSARNWLEHCIRRSRTEIFSEEILVTPELAHLILKEKNTNNRPIYPTKLEMLKSDMNNGRFKLNGESVIFAKTGELNDGQHRLTAVAETGKPQRMIFLFGVNRDTRLTVDTGKARTAGDFLALKGEILYTSIVATTARLAIAYEKTSGESLGRPGAITTSEIFERVNDDGLLLEAAIYAGQHSHKFRSFIKPGYIGFCFYQFAKRKPQLAKAFMDKLRDGLQLKEDDPIYVLRQYLINRPKLTQKDRLEVVIRAWNAWINNEHTKSLRIYGTFPEIIG
jgi:hypothetical protein